MMVPTFLLLCITAGILTRQTFAAVNLVQLYIEMYRLAGNFLCMEDTDPLVDMFFNCTINV